MRIVEEYKAVCKYIAVVESKLRTAKRERESLFQTRFGGIGIDYSKERVVSSGYMPVELEKAFETAPRLDKQIEDLETELQDLRAQQAELDRVISELGDLKEKIIRMQIQGYRQAVIARELGYSKVWIEKNCSEIRKEYGKSMVSSVV